MNARLDIEKDPRMLRVVRGVSMTEYQVGGTLTDCFEMIELIFDAYPPVGYGTRVHSLQCDYPSQENYTARMSRSNSCD